MKQLRVRCTSWYAWTPSRAVAIAVVCVFPALWSACSHHEATSKDSVAFFEKNLEEQLIPAKPGSVIDLPEGLLSRKSCALAHGRQCHPAR